MKREFRTEVYLLTGSELRVVGSEGGEEQPVGGAVECWLDTLTNIPTHSPRGGSAMGGGHFFVPIPTSVSPLTVASRPISLPTKLARAMSPPTRLPFIVADVHRPMGDGVYNFVGGASTHANEVQSTSFDRHLHGRHSDRTLRRLLLCNPDGADDRLC